LAGLGRGWRVSSKAHLLIKLLIVGTPRGATQSVVPALIIPPRQDGRGRGWQGARAGRSREEQGGAGRSREEQGGAGRSREGQGGAGRSREEQGGAGRSREEQGGAGRSREEQGGAARHSEVQGSEE
jgi:hypothetical protein